jgi:hypothetical protein
MLCRRFRSAAKRAGDCFPRKKSVNKVGGSFFEFALGRVLMATAGTGSGLTFGLESSSVGDSAVALVFGLLAMEGVVGICDTSSSSGGIDGGMMVQSVGI